MSRRVAGKGAGLGELTGVGLPVPPGFVISAKVFLRVLDETGVRAQILSLVRPILDSDGTLASGGSESPACPASSEPVTRRICSRPDSS